MLIGSLGEYMAFTPRSRLQCKSSQYLTTFLMRNEGNKYPVVGIILARGIKTPNLKFTPASPDLHARSDREYSKKAVLGVFCELTTKVEGRLARNNGEAS